MIDLLVDEPPATPALAVLRTTADGCRRPVVVRRAVGAPARDHTSVTSRP